MGSRLQEVLTRAGTTRLLEADDVLQLQHAPVDFVSVVVRGELVVAFDAHAEEPVAQLSAGAVVNLAAFISREPAEAFVVADVGSEVRVVDRPTFDALMAGDAELRQGVLEFVSQLARRLEEREWTGELVRRRHWAHGLFDSLTSAHSKRWLKQALPRFVARHEQEHEPLCAVLFNLDHFKRFNDEHGFQAGDEALRVVATTAWQSLRISDRLVRVGGEEFVALLPSTTLDEGAVAAERVRVAIAGAPLRTMDTSLPPVTVSLGVACHVMGAEPEAFIERARVAKFDAKLAGRNQVAVSPTLPR